MVIFHDITEIKNTEKIKKDFILNVSHELRTPLTAIKGFIESLGTEIDKKNLRYLDILKRNTERLINIVNDLLVLSELEDRETVLRLEDVDLNQLIEDIRKIFEQKLKEKKLNLKIQSADKHITVKADSFQLEQIFINLIDNAIKYTQKGGIVITVKQDKKYTTISIEDTGIGIPKENLTRIFERFYVVNKSRSRSLGGTGLGLSIVKHIVLLHNGKIDVESTLGKGTKFTISLPNNLS
jgi:two-component system phosphate regulon sensor histidine kinase PhoR